MRSRFQGLRRPMLARGCAFANCSTSFSSSRRIFMANAQKFQKFIVTEARTNGLSPERLGEAVHVALSTAKPKARYAVIPQRFKNWTLPRLLPARMVDAAVAKQMGLKKP